MVTITEGTNDRARVLETANDSICHSAYRADFQDVRVSYCDGTLTLEGKLPSFYMKQVLQTILRELDGVEQIANLTAVEEGEYRNPNIEIQNKFQ